MTPEPEGPYLPYLRRLDAKMDRLIDEVGELRQQMIDVQESIASLRKGSADLPV